MSPASGSFGNVSIRYATFSLAGLGHRLRLVEYHIDCTQEDPDPTPGPLSLSCANGKTFRWTKVTTLDYQSTENTEFTRKRAASFYLLVEYFAASSTSLFGAPEGLGISRFRKLFFMRLGAHSPGILLEPFLSSLSSLALHSPGNSRPFDLESPLGLCVTMGVSIRENFAQTESETFSPRHADSTREWIF